MRLFVNNAFRVAISNRNVLGKNGASRILIEQAQKFSSKGARVYLYVSRINKALVSKDITIKHFFSLNPIKKIRREQFAYKFKDFCNRSNIDLSIGNGDTVHQQVLFMHNLIELENKFVPKMQDLNSNYAFLIHDQILKEKNFELLVCNSLLMKNFIQQKYSVSDEDCVVLYPGYDPKKFNTSNKLDVKNAFIKKYNLKKNFIVGFVTSGNLKKRGIDIFFKILMHMPKHLLDDISFIVVGKEKNFKSYLAKYPQLYNNINYIEPIDDVENIFKSLDVLVHPALIEEFGMVVLESMACGVPVITSKRVGASEIFENNLTDLVTNEPNPLEFSKKLTEIITNSQKRINCSLIASNIATKYTWNSYFAKLFEIYAFKQLIPKSFIQS